MPHRTCTPMHAFISGHLTYTKATRTHATFFTHTAHNISRQKPCFRRTMHKENRSNYIFMMHARHAKTASL
jgi:hypothetical protein